MEDNKFTLYRHISPSGKVYIGITSQPVEHRWNHGKGYTNNSKKTLFKSTIEKYGWDNIKHEVLFTHLSKEKAKNLEIELIRHYKGLGISLNCTNGGDGAWGIIPWNKNKKVPYEQSNKLKGTHLSEEHKKKLSMSHIGKKIKGHKWTEQQRLKLIANMTGRHHSDDVKRKIKENSAFSKEVVEFDFLGNQIKTFKSASDASKSYGIDRSFVAKACRKKTYCCGHIFLYKEDANCFSDVKYGRHKDDCSITVENINTGETKAFNSLGACARFFNFKSTSNIKKVIGKCRLIKGLWKVISVGDKLLDYTPTPLKIKPIQLCCKNVETGEVLIFSSISEFRRFIGLSSDTAIQKALHGIRSNNIIKGWEVNYAA